MSEHQRRVQTSHGFRFERILFSPMARRGNSAAARRVAALAAEHGAELTIVGVIREPSRLDQALHREHVDEVLRAEHHEMRQRLDRCVRRLPVDASTVIDVDSPAHSIVQRVVAAEHDLLAVTVDSRDASTARRLLRTCPCPVWVVRPTRAGANRVLAAIDPEPEERELNTQVLRIAASMVTDDEELHVVHAWELFGESTMRSSAFVHVDPAEIDRRREQIRLAHERAVHELTDAAVPAPVARRIELAEGSPADVIVEVVRRERINLLVMGTEARRGVAGLVMGNTAERVLDAVGCSLVAIKPPGAGPPSSGAG